MPVLGTAQGHAAALELEKGPQPPQTHFARGSHPVKVHGCTMTCYVPQCLFHTGLRGADPCMDAGGRGTAVLRSSRSLQVHKLLVPIT